MNKPVFLLLPFLCSVAFAQDTPRSHKFSLAASVQVMNRPTTFECISEPSGMYTPTIITDFREQNVGFGVTGIIELKHNPSKLAFSIGTTGRVAKLYDVLRVEEIRDTSGKFISAAYDYNKWAPVSDIHFELTKYITLKDEKLIYFSIGVNQFMRGTYPSSRRVVVPDSLLHNRTIKRFVYDFGFSAMNFRIGMVQKNVTASLGVYFPDTDIITLEFYGGFKSIIPEFRIGYRFKVI